MLFFFFHNSPNSLIFLLWHRVSKFLKWVWKCLCHCTLHVFYNFFSNIKDGGYIQHGDFFLASFSRRFDFHREFEKVKFLHILKEQNQKKFKKMLPKSWIQVVAKFKMATRTKFVYVAKKTLVRLRTFGQFDFYRFWAKKNKKKIFGSSKIKYGRSIQDGRQHLIYF
jgi:hypothetical protein